MPAFIDRDPTADELERFRLLMSLHRYGIGPGGQLKSGELYPHWTFIEIAFAEALGGIHVPAGKLLTTFYFLTTRILRSCMGFR